MSDDDRYSGTRLDEIMHSRRRKRGRNLAIVATLVVVAALYFVWQPNTQELSGEGSPATQPDELASEQMPRKAAASPQLERHTGAATPTELPSVASPGTSTEPPTAIALPELSASDALVRKRIDELSARHELDTWLSGPDLARRFVVSVVNIAEGQSPQKHLRELRPLGKFSTRMGRHAYFSAESYQRYDVVAQIFDAVDTSTTTEILTLFEPLFDQAYLELGYPAGEFRSTLEEAFRELLQTPVVEGDPPLELDVLTYEYLDSDLEKLSSAQKQLLRMGPSNVKRIQAKLRQLAQALEIPEDRLPAPSVYRVGEGA